VPKTGFAGGPPLAVDGVEVDVFGPDGKIKDVM
jgi:hypothetical protein